MEARDRLNRNQAAWLPLVLIAVMVLFSWTVSARADEESIRHIRETTQLVEKAKLTLDSFMQDSNMGAFRDLMKDAKGVLIVPQMLKGAFVVGVSGGSGVLLTRDGKPGQWVGPAFYTIGGASFGFQIGGESSEVILLAMTDRGVTSFLSNSFKLGGDVGIAVGPVGAGVAASTANLSADILTFSRSKGLYGGISLDGAVVAVRREWNDDYYGMHVAPADIFARREVSNPQAAALIEDISRSTCAAGFC